MSLIPYIAHFLRGMFVSLLPPQYRKWWIYEHTSDFLRAALISELLEFLISVVLLSGLFFDYAHRVPQSMDRYSTDPVMVAMLTAGYELFQGPAFLLNPIHMLLFYFFLEGIWRALAVATTQESIGTLPLYLVSWGQDWLESRRLSYLLGPPVIDEVLTGDRITHDVCVRTCRPKADWNSHITIRFRNEFYLLAGEEAGLKPRPFIYRLRRNPDNRAVVVVREYRPS